jgi:YfiH family protein
MLSFCLRDLNIYVSQRDDGDFRQAQPVEEFLKKQFFTRENFALLHLQLENKDQVIVIEKQELITKKPAQVFNGDAIISNFQQEKLAKRTLISMVVADCFPLIFFDQKSKNVAMIHAGWKPLYLGILEKVWNKMLQLWQTDSQQIWAFLGPGIRAKSYYATSKPMQLNDQNWQKFIKKIPPDLPVKEAQKWQVDLPAFIKNFLDKNGLPKEQLNDSQLDTYDLDNGFFSYRRSQEHLARGEQQLAEESDGRFFVICDLPNR